MSRRLALMLFVAMSIPFGIAGHLLSEFVALGTADRVAFSPIHAYLAMLAVGVLLVFALAGRRVARMANALPWQGRGVKFFVLSVSIQTAFVAITQVAEGAPIDRGDLLAGIIAAILVSIAGAFFLNAVRNRLVRIVVALCDYLDRCSGSPLARSRARQCNRFVQPAFASFCVAIANRPPPRHSF
jgi:hypothetical protein